MGGKSGKNVLAGADLMKPTVFAIDDSKSDRLFGPSSIPQTVGC